MNDTPVQIAEFRLPFFPMRPVTSFRIRPSTFNSVMDNIFSGEWFPQKKLDGDRALLGVIDGQIVMANRHGSCFKHPVLNKNVYLGLPTGTLLDGEVWDRKFIPFEALVINYASLTKAVPSFRAAQAEKICKLLKIEWLFTAPTREWIQSEMAKPNSPWEGVVCKAVNSPYIPMGSETAETSVWAKMKWR